MLRLASYDIVFQEVPGEVTLALNISNCPNRCPGCHSPHLQDDVGEILDEELLSSLLGQYGSSVTCVCFMGGDADPAEVNRMAGLLRESEYGCLKTGWYSGASVLPSAIDLRRFDYIKLGPFIESLGGLGTPGTNQKFYRVTDGRMRDITNVFVKRS